jgi:hypothetical protein
MKSLVAIGAFFVLLGSISTSEALPLTAGKMATGSNVVTQVGWRCGPGWHWSPYWQRCVWNGWRWGW